MWEEFGKHSDQIREMNWWWNKARSEIVDSCLSRILKTKGNILDIGAGFGSMSVVLKKYGEVTAIEPSASAAAFLRDSLKLTTYTGDFDSFQSNDKFDLIACLDVLEHIDKDRQALLKIESLLNDNGILVVTVPAYMFLWSIHDDLNHHYRRYTKKGLIRILPDSFNIRKITYYNTIMFPAAIIDKLLLSRNKTSYSLKPHKFMDRILYKVFLIEKYILKRCDFPFGVSILVIAQKKIVAGNYQ